MPRHSIPLYGGSLYVHRTQNSLDAAYRQCCRAQTQAMHIQSNPAQRDGEVFSAVINDGLQVHAFIRVRNGARIAHEATHCAQSVASHISMDPLTESEGFAYLVEWFYERIKPR